MKTLILILALASCAKAKPEPDPVPPPEPTVSEYQQTVDRALTFADAEGYIVVRDAAGTPKHLGDAAWRTGLAMAAMPCDAAEPLALSLSDMIHRLGGGFWRHPSMPDEVSMDQVLPYYLAVARQIGKCPRSAEAWRETLTLHRDFMQDTGDRLNPNSDEKLPVGFDYVRDLLLSRLDLAGEPSDDRKKFLETELWLWALAVRHSPAEIKQMHPELTRRVDAQPKLFAKAACFRVNLAWIAASAIDALGKPMSESMRGNFCGATDGLGLEHVDHLCGRPGLDEFLASWQANQWDDKFQRCRDWETPDCIGDQCAGIDKLEAMVEKYQL